MLIFPNYPLSNWTVDQVLLKYRMDYVLLSKSQKWTPRADGRTLPKNVNFSPWELKRRTTTYCLHMVSQRIQKPYHTINTLLFLDYRKIYSPVWRATGWDSPPCRYHRISLKISIPFFQVLQRQFRIKWRHLERSSTIWKDSHLCGYCYIALK